MYYLGGGVNRGNVMVLPKPAITRDCSPKIMEQIAKFSWYYLKAQRSDRIGSTTNQVANSDCGVNLSPPTS